MQSIKYIDIVRYIGMNKFTDKQVKMLAYVLARPQYKNLAKLLEADYPDFSHYLSVGKEKGQIVRYVYFVTVNPDSAKCNLGEFRSIVDSFIKKKTIKAAYWVYEQRGNVAESNIGSGYHTHILCICDTGQFVRNTTNSFKHVVGDNAPLEKVIHITRVKYHQFVVDKINYMSGGEKWSIDKQKKAQGDIMFREHNSISAYYAKNKSLFNV